MDGERLDSTLQRVEPLAVGRVADRDLVDVALGEGEGGLRRRQPGGGGVRLRLGRRHLLGEIGLGRAGDRRGKKKRQKGDRKGHGTSPGSPHGHKIYPTRPLAGWSVLRIVRAGSRTWKADPRPRDDMTRTEPPCNSASCRTIANPSPAPRLTPDSPASARQNGSNTLAR